jgi:hypothetical protein
VSDFNMKARIAVAFALPPDDRHPFEENASIPMSRCEIKGLTLGR